MSRAPGPSAQPRSYLLGWLLLLGACATAGEQIYVAPSDTNVTGRLEATMAGDGQYIVIENASSVDIVVNSVRLSNCENIVNPCDVIRMDVTVPARGERRVLTVRHRSDGRGSRFSWTWSWQATNAVPRIPGGPGR